MLICVTSSWALRLCSPTAVLVSAWQVLHTLLQVSSDVLELLLDYCRFHHAQGRSDKVRIPMYHLHSGLQPTSSCKWKHCACLQLRRSLMMRITLWCHLILAPPHLELPATRLCAAQERKAFDERYIRMDTRRLCELTSAADALDMKPLVDLASRALARLIEGKTPEQVSYPPSHAMPCGKHQASGRSGHAKGT